MDWSSFSTVLAAGILSVFGIVVGALLTAHLTEGRERRQHFGKSESDRLLLLEERVGLANEYASLLPKGVPADAELQAIMNEVRLDAGRFGRYDPLSAAVRQFYNSAMWLVRQKLKCEDTRDAEKELRESFLTALRIIKELR